MRIAQIAPLIESVPPSLYGGTERVVYHLTEELVRRGHRVTLYASGDSRTRARLRPLRPRSTRLDPTRPDPWAWHLLELATVFEQAAEFDVIHSHVDYLAFPFAETSPTPVVHTLHGRLDLSHWPPMLRRYGSQALVSISDAQRAPLEGLKVNWAATIRHGLPDSAFRPGSGRGGYLAFFGRLSPEKGPVQAIKVARRVGLPLKIAGKVDEADRLFFHREVEPLLGHPLIEYIGEIGDPEKTLFLGEALALLFPVDWPEPFGLAMIEAMATGTPVIARPCGSVPEIVEPGRTGFIAGTVEEMAQAVRQAETIDRAACLRRAREKFSVSTMADRYEALYRRMMSPYPAVT